MSATAEDFDDGYEDGEEGGLSGFYVLAIFLALLAAFLVIVYFAYQKGVANGMAREQDLPVVAADPRPVREEVELATADDRRREVYDRLEGVTPTSVVAEADPARDPLEGYQSDSPAGTAADRTPSEPATAEPSPVPARKPETRPAETPAATARKPAPAAERPQAATPAAERPAPAAAAAGTHAVQVGAFGSDEEALRFYETLSGRLGGLVSDKSPNVQRAEVNGRTYHRLRLTPFTSKEAADRYCADLKSRGQDCLVRPV